MLYPPRASSYDSHSLYLAQEGGVYLYRRVTHNPSRGGNGVPPPSPLELALPEIHNWVPCSGLVIPGAAEAMRSRPLVTNPVQCSGTVLAGTVTHMCCYEFHLVTPRRRCAIICTTAPLTSTSIVVYRISRSSALCSARRGELSRRTSSRYPGGPAYECIRRRTLLSSGALREVHRVLQLANRPISPGKIIPGQFPKEFR